MVDKQASFVRGEWCNALSVITPYEDSWRHQPRYFASIVATRSLVISPE